MFEYGNLDIASIGLSRELLENGVKTKRSGHNCVEIPNPVMIKISDPLNHFVTIKGRKASKSLPFGECLALLSGCNNMDLYAGFVPDMMKYSDDGVFQRAGYGPRIRGFIGVNGDYINKFPILKHKKSKKDHFGEYVHVDQFKYVIETLKKDPTSRQAVISITDPANDQFNSYGGLKTTKDIPCCRLLQFMVVNGKLDCIAYFRSNDLLFGFQQVNVFNNCFIMQCISMILDTPIGNYYHIADNLHYYVDKEDLVQNNAFKTMDNYEKGFDWQGYDSKCTLEQFDLYLTQLFRFFNILKSESEITLDQVPTYFEGETFIENDLFKDWAKVFFRFFTKQKQVFKSPYINRLFNVNKLKPNTKYVSVKKGEDSWELYEVTKPKAYIKKCQQDGKIAIYAGETDKFGYLNK